eukprot:1136713-Pelagomonas_calceolata.AAC.2
MPSCATIHHTICTPRSAVPAWPTNSHFVPVSIHHLQLQAPHGTLCELCPLLLALARTLGITEAALVVLVALFDRKVGCPSARTHTYKFSHRNALARSCTSTHPPACFVSVFLRLQGPLLCALHLPHRLNAPLLLGLQPLLSIQAAVSQQGQLARACFNR